MGRRISRTYDGGVLKAETIEELDALAAALYAAEAAEAEGAAKEIADAVADGAIPTSVLKADAPQRYTLGVACAAMKPDVGIASDGYRDFLAPETIERTAWGYMAKSRAVGLYHADGTEGHGTVVESYVYRGPDWEIAAADGSTQVVKAGDWLLGVVWDEETWPMVEQGHINGLSVQGMAQRAAVPVGKANELRSGHARR